MLIKHGTKVARAKVQSLDHVINVVDFSRSAATELQLNDLARITVRSSAALAVDEYQNSRTAGSFLLIDPNSGATLAAGIIEAQNAAA